MIAFWSSGFVDNLASTILFSVKTKKRHQENHTKLQVINELYYWDWNMACVLFMMEPILLWNDIHKVKQNFCLFVCGYILDLPNCKNQWKCPWYHQKALITGRCRLVGLKNLELQCSKYWILSIFFPKKFRITSILDFRLNVYCKAAVVFKQTI